MFRLSQWLTLYSAFLLLAGWARAQGTKTTPVADHGVVLATAVDAAPGKLKDTTKVADTKNYVYRSRIISLDKDRSVSYCFDAELMRVAAVWVGKPVSYIAGKNMGPAVEGQMVFTTQPGPGWSRKGQWKDPRDVPEGPLPRAWARYDGVYLHGNRAVLSYTVGDCAILEGPDVQRAGDQLIITRTLNLKPTAEPLSLLVCEEPGVKWHVRHRRPIGAGDFDTVIELAVGKESVVAGAVGLPQGAEWEATASGRVHLHLPALPKGASLRLAMARLGEGKKADLLDAALQAPVEDLTPLTKGGPTRWTQVLETKGTVSADTKSPYVLDTIDLPADNPWKASIRFGGMDFYPDGRAALCTWDGDVWVVSGLEGKLDAVKWKRFASGLQQPLGLKIVDGVIYTAGRDQVTRLVDLNNNGEADFLQNLNNEPGLTLQRHEFVMDLQTDKEGNFYFCRSGHYVASKKGENCCVYKMSPDGRKLEIVARGFREPNGMSIGPDDTMTVSDNEGNGVPQTPIYHLQAGKFYGFTPGGGYKAAQPPIVWLPKNVDRSAGSQIWVPKDQWGPLGGQLLHTSYGNCALFSLLIDKKAEPWHGAVWKFPMAFNSGIMRGRFSPTDGQLYVCGLRGWDTSATKDGQLARIRFTGSKAPVPVGLAMGKNAISVTFSAPLDREAAEDDQNWGGEWSASKDKKGKEELPIGAVKLSQDGRTVTVELERMVPVMNYTLQYDLKGTDGSIAKGTLNGSIHKVP